MMASLARRPRAGVASLRVAGLVVALLAFLLSAAALGGMWYERHRVTARTTAAAGPAPAWSMEAAAAIAALVLAGLGAGALAAFLHHRATRAGFERIRAAMQNVLQSIPTGVLTLDRDGVLTSLNSAAERLLERRAAAIVGRPAASVLEGAPDLAAWIHAGLAGDRLPGESDFTLVLAGGRRATIRASASELRDEAGGADGIVVLLRDITEVSRLEAQLRRADKLAALGTLAAGVAHEVKNPLHALSLNLHLLQEALAAPDATAAEVKDYFEILRSEIQRIHRIVENFLRFARPAIPEVRPLDLNGLLERVLSLVAFEAAGHDVTIETSLGPSLEAVPGDEGQLAQVFLNVAINALQAMPGGGVLTVTSRAADGWAEVAISDTGEGIRGDVLPHVFDPYFTTRAGGVGLGLAIAHRIVEGHHGVIDVESEAGLGTTVTVRLPLGRAGGDH